MSQRTIVEFNHDLSFVICGGGTTGSVEFSRLLGIALASGSRGAWKPLERYGIRRIVQCHHSDERKVVTQWGEYPID